MKRFYDGAQKPPKHTIYRNLRPIQWFQRIAAVLIIFFCTYTISLFLHREGETSETKLTVSTGNKMIIPKGQKGQLILSDGTKIWLNSESTLEHPSSFETEREVTLSGEAYFEVKSDEEHPFYVHTGNLKIKVTGTSFNIKAYADEDIETTLVEGRLSILKNDTEIIVLKPNESAVYSETDNHLLVKDLTVKEVKPKVVENVSDAITPMELLTVWKEDKLIFQDESLESMVNKMERWFNHKIHISDPGLLDNRYNGKFVYNETIYQVLDVVCRAGNLKYQEINREFYISK